MVGLTLPEPVLTIVLDILEKIQGSEDTVGALWSVFSRVRDAIENGHRLENMSWRLWYFASQRRRSRLSIGHQSDFLPPPLWPLAQVSGDGLSSGHWDRATPSVGKSHWSRKPQASPRHGNLGFHPPSGPRSLDGLAGQAPTLAAPHESHHLDSGAVAGPSRVFPLPPPESSQHQRQVDAATDAPHARGQRNTKSVPSDQDADRQAHVAGLNGASSGPPAYCFACGVSSSTRTTRTVARAPSSSMPMSLPSFSEPQADAMSVGQILADLFQYKPAHGRKCSRGSSNDAGLYPSGECRDRRADAPVPSVATPEIVEPGPSTPPSRCSTSRVYTPSSTSAATSATATPREIFPTVIVVNPTPHTTPPTTPTPVIRPENKPQIWSGALNGQLATPVSLNGDARSMSPVEPVVEPKPLPATNLLPHMSSDFISRISLSTSAIPLSERPSEASPSHLPSPSSNPHPEISTSSMSAVEDKKSKFFLAAPQSGSGPESSESPGSLGGNSVSPPGPSPLSQGSVKHVPLEREEEVASSYSAGSPAGRAPSVTSSKGGLSRRKPRVGFAAIGGNRRRQAPKKVAAVPKQPSARKDAELDAKQAEGKQKSRESEQTRSKGKEKAVADSSSKIEPTKSAGPAISSAHQEAHQQRHSNPSHPQNLRQLPTVPPRQQERPPIRRTASETPALLGATQQQPNPRQPLYHPQFGHLGLGHLPTVPPRNRRTIEITETSSEYETTDTDDSSWESESFSGDEAGEGEGRERSNRGAGDRSRGTTGNRTRDAGEFQRDAEREAQRARELFQKLPPRTYSNLGHLSRTKSGLSMLFHPDPETFPNGHPYRVTRDSRDILARNWSAPGHPLVMTNVAQRAAVVGPSVTAEPVMTSVPARQSAGPRSNESPRGGRVRRGPPQDQEQETDSGEDDPEDAIQVASSVAQRRLEAIMGGRPKNSPQRSAGRLPASHPKPQMQAAGPPPIARTTTAPVLMHPFLPDPAPLQTPHTVRRNIISQELDEELRRNLLWERSQTQIQGRPARVPGSILPGPWRRLTGQPPENSGEEQVNVADKGPGKRSFATQRNKSWANDYHAAGW